MQRVRVELPDLVGRSLFLRIVDRNRGSWGHVTFDDFSAEGEIEPEKTRPCPRFDVEFRYAEVSGIGKEAGVCRRDPSDVLRVGEAYHVWYSKTTAARKLYPSGYNATVWHAVSPDEGRSWEERGEAVGLGGAGTFDSFGAFTPNIFVHRGRYYLSYTAVGDGFTNRGYGDSGRTAIGLALADSPDGPWAKSRRNPVLESTREPSLFDSFRVDDTCFIVGEGRIRMYYKGRQWERTPAQTKMGVAMSEAPEGPYRRLNGGRPVQASGHEVLVWPLQEGTLSLVSDTGPEGRTLQFSPDGISFRLAGELPDDPPKAPGAFRPDLTDPSAVGRGISWGICMASYQGDPYLLRYEVEITPK